MPERLINGLRLHYDVWPPLPGAPSPALPLVIVHGVAPRTGEWTDVIEAARALGPVLTYDLRGHGGSAPSPDPRATSIDHLTADLAGLLDALGIPRVHLLGHSLGGMVALSFVLRHPERVGALILESTTPEAPAPAARERMLRLALRRAAPGQRLIGGGDRDAGEWPGDLQTALTAPAPPPGHAAAEASSLTAGTAPTDTVWALINHADQTARLEGVERPTLVIVGELEQESMQRGAELLHGWMPASRLVRIPDAAHRAHQEQPDFFNDLVVRFVREVVGANKRGND